MHQWMDATAVFCSTAVSNSGAVFAATNNAQRPPLANTASHQKHQETSSGAMTSRCSSRHFHKTFINSSRSWVCICLCVHVRQLHPRLGTPTKSTSVYRANRPRSTIASADPCCTRRHRIKHISRGAKRVPSKSVYDNDNDARFPTFGNAFYYCCRVAG